VLLLWGGVISDRFPRALVLQVSNVASALTQGAIAVLVLTGTAQLWMITALAVLHGAVSALSFPAMASMVQGLVPRDQLQPANALISLTRNGLTVLGPTIGALLVVTVGSGWAIAVDAVTWLLSAVLLLGVRLPARSRTGERASTLTELREGWSFFRRTSWLFVVVLGFSVLNAIHSGAWFVLGPVVAEDTIGRQSWGYVLSAEALGLVAMGVVTLRVRLERPLLVGMVGVGFMGVPMLVLGLEPQTWALVAAAFLAGAGVEVFSLGWNLAMMENVDERMLSRAFSYDALGSFVAMPLGQLAFGPLGDRFGFRDVLVVSGLAYAAVVGLVLCSRSVRRLPRAPREDAVASEVGVPG
jgi:MFS family permease